MNLFAVGLNHRTAPIELREQLAVPKEQLGASLPQLVQGANLREVMLLSTCNRVEIYGVGKSPHPTRVVEVLADIRGIPERDLEQHCFARGDESAARHIFRVAASLESMVVGEPQILGQVKDAYQAAREVGTVGAILDRCLTMAFKGAKRARTETGIARGAASIPSVAVDLAVSIFGELTGRKVLLVGAGDMAEQAAGYLRSGGVTEIVVVNRTEGRARALAETIQGRYAQWSELENEVRAADIVVTSTGSTAPIIGPKLMKRVLRARRGAPVFMVDIAVPRDVDTRVSKLEGVFLYNVDDLQGVVTSNLENRAGQADLASRVVDQEIDAFWAWNRSRVAAPVLQRLQVHGQQIVDAETEKALNKLGELPEKQREVVRGLARQVMKKLLHRPMTVMRETAVSDGSESQMVEALSDLFGLASSDIPADDSTGAPTQQHQDSKASEGEEQ